MKTTTRQTAIQCWLWLAGIFFLLGPASPGAADVTNTASATYSDTASNPYTVNSLTVLTVVNNPPIPLNQSVTTPEDTARAITLTGTDPESQPLTFTVVANPTNGTLSGTGATRTYTPNANFNGTDSFTFRVNDGLQNSTGTATVSITVTGVNDAPVAVSTSATTAEDTARTITLVATDIDGNPLTYRIVTAPAHGTLSGTGPNVTYTPAANYNGTDSFTFVANDGLVDSNIATVSLTITSVNDAPVASFTATPASGNAPLAVSFNATASSDVDGTISTYAWTFGDGQTGTGSTANHTYSSSGTYTAILTVTDNNGATATTNRVISVSAPLVPNVVLNKSVNPTSAIPGTVLTYTISGQNTGNGNALNVVVNDAIPVGTTLVNGSITGGGTASGGVITWTIGTVNAGASFTSVSFQVTVN